MTATISDRFDLEPGMSNYQPLTLEDEVRHAVARSVGQPAVMVAVDLRDTSEPIMYMGTIAQTPSNDQEQTLKVPMQGRVSHYVIKPVTFPTSYGLRTADWASVEVDMSLKRKRALRIDGDELYRITSPMHDSVHNLKTDTDGHPVSAYNTYRKDRLLHAILIGDAAVRAWVYTNRSLWSYGLRNITTIDAENVERFRYFADAELSLWDRNQQLLAKAS